MSTPTPSAWSARNDLPEGQVDLLGRRDGRPEEAGTHLDEAVRNVSDVEALGTAPGACRRAAAGVERFGDGLGRRVSRVHQSDVRAKHLLQHPAQQGVVRATEDDGVHAPAEQGFEVTAGDEPWDV